jgi:hypothetical protein
VLILDQTHNRFFTLRFHEDGWQLRGPGKANGDPLCTEGKDPHLLLEQLPQLLAEALGERKVAAPRLAVIYEVGAHEDIRRLHSSESSTQKPAKRRESPSTEQHGDNGARKRRRKI